MRFGPLALALSLALGMTNSAGIAADYQPSARASMLLAQGRAALEAGDTQKATDAFEAALAIDPGYATIYIDLAEAARRDGLQGKAIRYYRTILARDPENFAAISGEGEALVEKGAMAKARRNLDTLKKLCGRSCPETRKLAHFIASGPQQRVLTAENVTPETQVSQN